MKHQVFFEIGMDCAGSCMVVVGLAYAGFRSAASPAATSSRPAPPPLLIDWTLATYLELDDELSAQAMSPSGQWIASSDRNGVSVQSIQTHNTRLLNIPEGLRLFLPTATV